MISAREHGWAQLRTRIYLRDRGCVAGRREIVGDAAALDLCSDNWGMTIPYDRLELIELMHVKAEPMGGRKAPDDEAHLVAGCPGHHRGMKAGYCWGTSDPTTEALRAYLTRKYPEVWV